MSALLAMGVPTTTDTRGYFVWLAHNWPVFVPAALAFCAVLVGLVVHIVKSWSRATPDSSGPDAPPQAMDGPPSPVPGSGSDADIGIRWPFELPCYSFVG